MQKMIWIFSLTLLAACQSQKKSNPGHKEGTAAKMWADFTDSHPEFKDEEMPEAWYFHDNKRDANRLAALTVAGRKQASSGLYTWYREANADLPKVGTKHIVTDFEGRAQCLISVTKVDTIPFFKISKAYAAMDMGTEQEPLKKWKDAHWKFFKSALSESGKEPTEDMLVVCEQFQTIWPE